MDTSYSTTSSALIKLRAALIPAGQTQPHFARTLELWPQRALLLCPVNLPSNARCQLFLEVPSNASKTTFESVGIACIVQFSVLVGQLSQYRIGVKFSSVSDEAERALERLLR